jgi:phage repressor protein C with HTH and peptisase S24 domain
MRSRAGMSLEDVARALGLKGKSSVQRFFAAHLETLTLDDAMRLADAFQGRGDPPISRAEVLAIGGHDKLFEIEPNKELPPRYRQQNEDVPVYGTALGTFRNEDDGPSIEQAYIDYSDTVDYFVRPPKYEHHDSLYGFYVQGSSMVPRFDDGDPAYADPKRPPLIGDDVVVYLFRPVGGEAEDAWTEELDAVLLKTLVKRTASYVELRQYNPDLTFTVDRKRIKQMHRVLNRRDLSARM